MEVFLFRVVIKDIVKRDADFSEARQVRAFFNATRECSFCLQHVNAASIKIQLKDDKPHHARTSTFPASFTRQFVRHAQGSRSVTRINDKADAECVTASQELMTERAREAVGRIPAD